MFRDLNPDPLTPAQATNMAVGHLGGLAMISEPGATVAAIEFIVAHADELIALHRRINEAQLTALGQAALVDASGTARA